LPLDPYVQIIFTNKSTSHTPIHIPKGVIITKIHIYMIVPNPKRGASLSAFLQDNKMPKIKIDELYFHSKSNAMYYVLGAWYASGKIAKKKYTKKSGSKSIYKNIEFTNKSERLVQIVKDELQAISPQELDERGDTHIRGLKQFNTPTLCDKLEDLGIDAKKDKLEFPRVPKKYLSHFIRGFLDAKAMLYKSKGRTRIDFILLTHSWKVWKKCLRDTRMWDQAYHHMAFAAMDTRHQEISMILFTEIGHI
jgi:hypothetical protein